MTLLRSHALADEFPLIEGEDFNKLVADIKAHGQREPIVLYEGKILDGRNRYRACLRARVRPKTVQYTGDNPIAYVLSENMRRRHLTKGQQALIVLSFDKLVAAAKAAAQERLKVGRSKGGVARQQGGRARTSRVCRSTRANRAIDALGRQFGIDSGTMEKAQRIKRDAPEAIADILSGKRSTADVMRELRESVARVQAIRDARERTKLQESPHIARELLDKLPAFREAANAYMESLSTINKAVTYEKFAPEARPHLAEKMKQNERLLARIITHSTSIREGWASK
jgi:hypothetical protein